MHVIEGCGNLTNYTTLHNVPQVQHWLRRATGGWVMSYLQVVGRLHFCVHGALEGRGVGGSLLQPLYKFNVQNKKKENKIKLKNYIIPDSMAHGHLQM